MKNAYLVDVQGHRGCRGLLPENSIIGFKKAFELGVTTLELDVVISKDDQVIISHDPFFHHKISTAPNKEEISEASEKSHKLFEKTYADIKAYDVGLKPHPDFADQQKIATSKPSLKDMVREIEALKRDSHKGEIRYNIELKRRPEWDGVYLPDVNKFVDLVLETIRELGIAKRTTLQCFDVECLQILNKRNINMPLVYLIGNTDSFQKNMDLLGFVPDVYSPYFKLVNAQLVDLCHEANMEIIPWTINEVAEMERLLNLKVDGIISDYPDRLIKVVKEKDGISIK